MVMPNPRQLSSLPVRTEGGLWKDLPSGGAGASPLCVEGAGKGAEVRRALCVPEHCHFRSPRASKTELADISLTGHLCPFGEASKGQRV